MPRGRKQNGSGTIIYMAGRAKPYRVQIAVNGQRKSGGCYATSEEASKALRALTVAVDEGKYIEPSKMTVGEWLTIWLDEYCVDIKSSTKVQYAAYIKNHIAPALGKVKLSALQPHQVQTFVNRLQSAKKGSKALSPKTIKNVHGCLSSALRQAEQIRYIKENPAKGCKLPKKDDEASIDIIKPLDAREIATFTDAVKGNRYELIYLFALNTGLRLSEILGLQWNRVNMDTGEIVIDRQLAILRKKGDTRRITPTKSRNKRTIIAPAGVLALLQKQRLQQKAWRLAAGAAWNNADNLVFTNELGESVPHASIEHQFRRLANGAGLAGHVFHDLRHTFAVEMLRAGTDIETVSKWLGHYDPGFTLRVYADMTPDMRQAAADRLQEIIEKRMQA